MKTVSADNRPANPSTRVFVCGKLSASISLPLTCHCCAMLTSTTQCSLRCSDIEKFAGLERWTMAQALAPSLCLTVTAFASVAAKLAPQLMSCTASPWTKFRAIKYSSTESRSLTSSIAITSMARIRANRCWWSTRGKHVMNE